jgi:hypothetical protein
MENKIICRITLHSMVGSFIGVKRSFTEEEFNRKKKQLESLATERLDAQDAKVLPSDSIVIELEEGGFMYTNAKLLRNAVLVLEKLN